MTAKMHRTDMHGQLLHLEYAPGTVGEARNDSPGVGHRLTHVPNVNVRSIPYGSDGLNEVTCQ
jgi:hypothetical protein